MSEDSILERVKAADLDLLAIIDWGKLRDLFGALIAEVKRKQRILKVREHNIARLEEQIENLVIRCHKAEGEVERLRSENRELKKTDIWANDVIKEHESLRGQIAAKDARIKELEATCDKMTGALRDAGRRQDRLEAAFLEQFAQGIQAPKEKAELMARETLEELRKG